jgi:aldose 1-epimerase
MVQGPECLILDDPTGRKQPQNPNMNTDPELLTEYLLGAPGELQVRLLNYGATLCSIGVPDGDDTLEALLGYPRNEDYLSDPYYLGSTVGRYAGRIRDGMLRTPGSTHRLCVAENTAGHCLHGGPGGFHKRFWHAQADPDRRSIRFFYTSADGEQGFPGRLEAEVRYSIMRPMRLLIEFRARTDRTTAVNLCNHAYFNLHKDFSSIYGHELKIDAGRFAPNDAEGLPTGEVEPVRGGAFDLRDWRMLCRNFESDDPALLRCGGYDHFFFVEEPGMLSRPGATLYSPQSGLQMDVFSTNPGLQLYTGNALDSPFRRHQALCLEFQDPPDAPNTPVFPSTLLEAGECYFRQTMLSFEWSKRP